MLNWVSNNPVLLLQFIIIILAVVNICVKLFNVSISIHHITFTRHKYPHKKATKWIFKKKKD